MIFELIDQMRKNLPCPLIRVDWSEPYLTIMGRDFCYSTYQSWRIISRERVIQGSCEDGDAISKVLEQFNETCLMEIDYQSKKIAADLSFGFSNGLWIETFSSMCLDSWTLRAAGLDFVYIGSPCDPECVDIPLP